MAERGSAEWLQEIIETELDSPREGSQKLLGKNLTVEEWMKIFIKEPEKLGDVSRSHFPTEKHLQGFIDNISKYPNNFIYSLLLRLLPSSSSFPLHDAMLGYQLKCSIESKSKAAIRLVLKSSYPRNCLLTTLNDSEQPTLEGCTWVIGLLPDRPNEALSALNSYGLAHLAFLPDSAIVAFFHAQEIIRAKFIGVPRSYTEYIESLRPLTSREFEHLTEALYHELGYETELTAPTGDGGRDVIARKSQPHESELIVIECKHYFEQNVGIAVVQRLLGVATSTRATKATIVTTAQLTEPALTEVTQNQALNYLDGMRLVERLTATFGPRWPLQLDKIIFESKNRDEQRRGTQPNFH